MDIYHGYCPHCRTQLGFGHLPEKCEAQGKPDREPKPHDEDDCLMCTGEVCEQHGINPCDCDAAERHTPVERVQPEPSKQGPRQYPPNRHLTVWNEDAKRFYCTACTENFQTIEEAKAHDDSAGSVQPEPVSPQEKRTVNLSSLACNLSLDTDVHTTSPSTNIDKDLDAWSRRLAMYWPDSAWNQEHHWEKHDKFDDRVKFYRSELEEFAKVVRERSKRNV